MDSGVVSAEIVVAPRRSRFSELRSSFGPAWIVMIADVDAASIITAAQDGAAFRYGLVWFLLLLIIPLFFIQEAAGRIGVVTGKGLGEVIRSNYSKRTAIAMSLPMAGTDVLSYVAEYAGIALGFELIGVPPYISLPFAYLAHLLLVFKKKYATVEKFLIAVSVVFVLSYVGSLIARGSTATISSLFTFNSSSNFVFLLAASAGAVVMPFMLFYQASATAEKKTKHLWASRFETLIGAIASEAIMVVILMATVGVSKRINFGSASDLARGLSALTDGYSVYFFAIGLIAAAFLALVVISLASAWAVTEALGIGRNRFFWIYLLESLPAVAIPLIIPNLFGLLLNSMVAFTFVLIGPGIILGLIASNRKILGKDASSLRLKVGYWGSLAAIVGCGLWALLIMF